MKIKKHRDLTMIDINESQTLVVSCDSSGGIGEKRNDIIKTRPEVVGYFATQVALMELLAFGARPITIVNTLSVEMDSTGNKILKGIKEALKPLDLDEDILVTGSTEENFPVTVTGIGITVIGIVDRTTWTIPKTKPGMLALVVGLPKVGDEVLQDKAEIMNISITLKLKKMDYIKEILPVGSKGILYELNQMANTNNMSFTLENKIDIDLNKSAGPSTCTIISIEEKDFIKFKEECPIPVNKIAKFIYS